MRGWKDEGRPAAVRAPRATWVQIEWKECGPQASGRPATRDRRGRGLARPSGQVSETLALMPGVRPGACGEPPAPGNGNDPRSSGLGGADHGPSGSPAS